MAALRQQMQLDDFTCMLKYSHLLTLRMEWLQRFIDFQCLHMRILFFLSSLFLQITTLTRIYIWIFHVLFFQLATRACNKKTDMLRKTVWHSASEANFIFGLFTIYHSACKRLCLYIRFNVNIPAWS